MAMSLCDMVFKNIIRGTSSFNLKASGLVLRQGLYSTRINGDQDTHEDFRPSNKLENSGTSLRDIVHQDVKENPIIIYMKGLPDAPRCGFSALAVKVLQQYRVPIAARNILESYELKEAVKSFSHWPTFPQIFVKGEFIGGSDIVLKMHQQGELEGLLADIKDSSSVE